MQDWIIEKLLEITPEEQRILSGDSVEKNLYTSQNEFVVEANKFFQEDDQISIRPHTRFVDFPPHKHNYIEIIYMVKGKTVHTLDQDKVSLDTGEILILNQQVLHSIKKANEGDLAINIVVLPSFFEYTLELFGVNNVIGKFLVQTFRPDKEESSYLHFKVGEAQPVQNLMENIIIHLINQETMHLKLIKITMALLMMELMDHTENLVSSSLDRKSLIIAEVLHEVEENYREPNLSAIATNNHVSLAYVSSLVKNETGQTFSEHLESRRMELAGFYLRETNMPIEDIIYLTGYSNSSFFYKVFKDWFGQTPNSYRTQKK
jgi:AraC-like DNA-binding protein/mannose-6-phosphate isomerase-like protein (cupin superfamily)